MHSRGIVRHMRHVVVGSTNEGKIIACRRAFRRAFGEVEVRGIAVPSGVAEQPRGDECFVGARNRAEAVRQAAKELSMSADYAVGIEGGMVKLYDRWFGFSAACVVDCRNDRVGYGTSPMFELPDAITASLLQGTLLGDIVTELTGDAAFRERRGAVGLLTRGLLRREDAHEYGVLAALAPHLSAERYGR